jgi:hypothetical protein
MRGKGAKGQRFFGHGVERLLFSRLLQTAITSQARKQKSGTRLKSIFQAKTWLLIACQLPIW